MLLFWIDYSYCYKVFCGYLGLTKIHKRQSARVELFCPECFLASQREPEGTKRLQSCFERVLVKHGHLESKNKLLGVIMEAINETNILFSFRNIAANALNSLPQNDDVAALNLRNLEFGCCCSGDALGHEDAAPCRKGNTFIGGLNCISDIRACETVKSETALLEQCSACDCRSIAGAMPLVQSMKGEKIQISSTHVLVTLSYNVFQTAYHYRLTKDSKENDRLYTTREMSQMLI